MTEYRYTLTREVFGGTGHLVWVMLNPSTADESVDDPTIRRVKSFTASNGYRHLTVINLFAVRSTNPFELNDIYDPVGGENGAVWDHILPTADAVVAAWGSTVPLKHAKLHGVITSRLRDRCHYLDKPLWCLGRTQGGHPRHPLYVKGDTPMEVF